MSVYIPFLELNVITSGTSLNVQLLFLSEMAPSQIPGEQ